MMKKISLLFAVAVSVIISCRDNKKGAVEIQIRDTTITAENAYSNLFFDSTAMESFIVQQGLADTLADKMRDFYNGRNYQYAWFDEKGIAEYTNTFLGMVNQYMEYARDSSVFNAALQQQVDSLAMDSNIVKRKPGFLREMELLLTEQFFNYSYKAYQANSSLNMQDLDWFIPRKKINPVAFLDSLLKNKGRQVSQYEPVNRQYNLLKDYLLKYYEAQKKGWWEPITADKKVYRPGDSSETLTTIKKRFLATGDISVADSSAVFDTTLTAAVKSFQHRYGLSEDGVIGPGMLRELNRPIEERIRQILINMERMRWVPAEPVTDYLLVNIPEFRLHIYEQGKYAGAMDVVVGSTAHNTVIFSDMLKYVVFSPYWNVPPGILKHEILPGIKRDPGYLAKHDMEWHNDYVRQRPGPNNSLGLVKFLFPNSYNIYLHDTPAKSLFKESRRDFSHGCIRLAEPKKLAEFLLRGDSIWTPEKITAAMNAGKERFVLVKDTVPVFIGYFTAWVDRSGKLNFRDDIYGHDKRMNEKLFGIKQPHK